MGLLSGGLVFLLLPWMILRIASLIALVFGIGAVLNVIQLASWLFIRPWNDKWDVLLNNFLLSSWSAICIFVISECCHYKVSVDADQEIPPSANVLLMCNHRNYLDFLLLFGIAGRSGRAGSVRFFAKNVIRYYPVIWGINFMHFILLRRSWEKDHAVIEKQLKRMQRHPDVPFWIGLFPEGSRFSVAKRDAAREFAKMHDIAGLWQSVLIPRPRGFLAVVEHLHDQIDFICSATLVYKRPPKGLLCLLAGLDSNEVHIHLRRISMGSLPANDREKLRNWLFDEFRRKDALISQWSDTGRAAAPVHHQMG